MAGGLRDGGLVTPGQGLPLRGRARAHGRTRVSPPESSRSPCGGGLSSPSRLHVGGSLMLWEKRLTGHSSASRGHALETNLESVQAATPAGPTPDLLLPDRGDSVAEAL